MRIRVFITIVEYVIYWNDVYEILNRDAWWRQFQFPHFPIFSAWFCVQLTVQTVQPSWLTRSLRSPLYNLENFAKILGKTKVILYFNIHTYVQWRAEGWFLAAELHLTLPPKVLHLTFLIAQANSLPPQVKCENKWGGKEFIWGGKKIFARVTDEIGKLHKLYN